MCRLCRYWLGGICRVVVVRLFCRGWLSVMCWNVLLLVGVMVMVVMLLNVVFISWRYGLGVVVVLLCGVLVV